MINTKTAYNQKFINLRDYSSNKHVNIYGQKLMVLILVC